MLCAICWHTERQLQIFEGQCYTIPVQGREVLLEIEVTALQEVIDGKFIPPKYR